MPQQKDPDVLKEEAAAAGFALRRTRGRHPASRFEVRKRGAGSAALLGGLAAAVCGAAQAVPCSPTDLMARVTSLTDLLEREMQQPIAARRAMVMRMRAVMQRHQQGTIEYGGICLAYDELIDQLRE